jgi:hypothetical protein
MDFSQYLRKPQCSPSDVALIKSSLKLLDVLEQFDKVSTKIRTEMLEHTKTMKFLTILILVFTVANVIILIVSILRL